MGFWYFMEDFMKVAVLVDGGFYRRRAQSCLGDKTPKERADELSIYCWRHIKSKYEKQNEMYRIFYYDCPPIQKKIYHPLLKQQIDLSKSDIYKWTQDFFDELKKKRKFALRLGKLAADQAHYIIRPDIIKKLCAGKIKFEDLTEDDFQLKVEQKGVDMKIGLDIASMAFKKQVEQIILISGDSDFVPAAKLARREGIDFILDSLYWPIKPDLFEHIDGLRTCDDAFKPKSQKLEV